MYGLGAGFWHYWTVSGKRLLLHDKPEYSAEEYTAFPLVPDESHTSSRVDMFLNVYKSVFVFIRMECKLYVTNKVNLRGLNSKLSFKAKSKNQTNQTIKKKLPPEIAVVKTCHFYCMKISRKDELELRVLYAHYTYNSTCKDDSQDSVTTWFTVFSLMFEIY